MLCGAVCEPFAPRMRQPPHRPLHARRTELVLNLAQVSTGFESAERLRVPGRQEAANANWSSGLRVDAGFAAQRFGRSLVWMQRCPDRNDVERCTVLCDVTSLINRARRHAIPERASWLNRGLRSAFRLQRKSAHGRSSNPAPSQLQS